MTKMSHAAASEIGASTKDSISMTEGSTRTQVLYDIKRSNNGSYIYACRVIYSLLMVQSRFLSG
jgi:hypothetical protein